MCSFDGSAGRRNTGRRSCAGGESPRASHLRVTTPDIQELDHLKGTTSRALICIPSYSIIFHHKLFHHISFPKLFHHIPSISPLPLTPWPLLHATGRRLRATKPSHVAPEPLPWPEQGKVLLEQPEGLNNLAGDVGMSDFEHQMY